MSILNNTQFGDLSRIIREAFSKAALEQLVKIELRDDLLGRVTSTAKPVKDIAFDLVTLYEQEDKTAELLAALVKERPRNIELRTLIAALSIPQPAPVSRPDTTGLAAEFGKGLEAIPAAVRAAARDPRIFFSIGILSGRLEPCRNELGWLRQYKRLHDGLHNLQAMLTAIDAAARDFARPPGGDGQPAPERVTAGELLIGHALELRDLADTAQAELDRDPPLPTRAEEAEWVTLLVAAVDEFDRAVQAGEPAGVIAALARLRGLIRQTAVVNDHMLFLARGLQLDQLRAAMQAVAVHLGAAGGAEIKQFRAGLAAVQRLGPVLTELVEGHNAWQELEADFALAATQTQAAPAERFAGWSDARAKLTALCALNHGDPLAKPVTAAATAYDAACAGPKAAADLAFISLRLAFTKMFFQVDDQLLELTNQLADQADALDAAARALADLLAEPAAAHP